MSIVDKILYTKFHIKWVFITLSLLIGLCVYGLSRLI